MVIQCASLSLLPLKVVFSPYIERIFLSPSLTHMAHYPAKHYLWTESLMLEVLHGVIRLFHGFDSFIGMPRKFRLSVHRKNEFRKRHAECVAASNQEDDHTLPVSIPLESVSVLKVSLPREMYLEAPISTISQLQRRLKALPVLPQGNQVGVSQYTCIPV